MSPRNLRREARRRRDRIDLLRSELIRALGGRCATADCPTPHDELEIDHVHGCTWDRAAAGRAGRHIRYAREYREGVPLQVLCRTCNARKNQHGLREAWAAFRAWLRGGKRAA